MLTAVEGIYKDGEVELLERPAGLREARVIVTFLPPTPAPSSQAEARDRMLKRMREGIPLGGPPYPRFSSLLEVAFGKGISGDEGRHPFTAGGSSRSLNSAAPHNTQAQMARGKPGDESPG